MKIQKLMTFFLFFTSILFSVPISVFAIAGNDCFDNTQCSKGERCVEGTCALISSLPKDCIVGSQTNTCPKGTTCASDGYCYKNEPTEVAKLKEGAECGGIAQCDTGLTCMGSDGSTIAKCIKSDIAKTLGNTHGYESPIRMSTDSDAETFVQRTIGKIISGILPIVGALFLVMFIYGGFLYLTAGGDSAKVDLAHKTFLNAVIGMAMVFCANFIITYFISAFGR